MQLTVHQLLEAVNGKLLFGSSDTLFRYVSTDSRAQMTTELFIPLVGENHDGHAYIESAVRNGAVGFLTQRRDVPYAGNFAVLVEDTTKALGDLASYVLKQSHAKVIAITGSVGKTTTRQFVASVVAEHGKTLATSGNFNNHIGLPLTVLKMEGDEDFLVLEMGMNHFGEISYLSRLAAPHIAIISLIGTSHIEYLGSRENILKAKLEILDGMADDGLLLLNGDDDLLSVVNCKQKIQYFGAKNARYPYTIVSEAEGTFLMDTDTYQIPIAGAHNIQNASAAVLLGKHLGMTPQQIQNGLSAFQSVGWRQKTEIVDSVTLIADCYNASLDSDRAALKVLANQKSPRKVAVLGPIGELGDFLEPILNQVGAAVKETKIDCLICVEEDSKYIRNGASAAGMNSENIIYFQKREDFIKQIPNLFHPGDAVLFKASRKYQFEELFEHVKQHLQTKE
ncbi:MAG: UDP-N-acetylmuramoyl-tripeptide--D-alanyl-D-alanine ligase [Clostridia bacterium]|nr:UDP-N-acetylmuramoyl-tripeptide--D-alanyl-D-alanine ligase [Clostridia bacterium]